MEILGDLLGGRRDDFVLASKFARSASPRGGLLATGNSCLAIVASVEASLKRLTTDRLGLYWVHNADGVTPIDEIVRGFNYWCAPARSSMPAFPISLPGARRVATIAELHGAIPIAGLQVEHSLVERTTEYKLSPMAEALGLGVVGWSPLGGGMLTGEYRNGEKGRGEGFGGKVFQAENPDQRTATRDAVIAIADEVGVTPGEIAIAWVAAKAVLPSIGPCTVQQPDGNPAATKIHLLAEQIERLGTVSAPAPIFPYTLLDDSREPGSHLRQETRPIRCNRHARRLMSQRKPTANRPACSSDFCLNTRPQSDPMHLVCPAQRCQVP